jgi:hypothetical protein
LIENPFTYGNPITDPQRFIGRQREVEQVYSRLLNAESESSSLVGERRIGKTSLLQYLMHPDVRARYITQPERYLFVYNDLQMIDPRTTPTRLAQRIIGQIARQSQQPEIQALIESLKQSEVIDNFALADLFDAFDSQGMHVILLLDEFENVTSNPNFGPDFFYGLRSLAIQHNLTLVTSSRSELVELTHSEIIRSSPFFNIFANINVRLFSADETNALIERSLDGSEVRFTPADRLFLAELAGAHPFFLQAACHFLYAGYTHEPDPAARLASARKDYLEEATPHFSSYWRDSSDPEKILLTTLALLATQGKAEQRSFSLERLRSLYDRSEQTLTALEKRGLLKLAGEQFALFCRPFGDWIVGEITNTMNDQQPYEEWLKSNQGALERLGGEARGQIGEILPKIGAKYRDLVIEWVSDPKNLATVTGLVKSALVMLA